MSNTEISQDQTSTVSDDFGGASSNIPKADIDSNKLLSQEYTKDPRIDDTNKSHPDLIIDYKQPESGVSNSRSNRNGCGDGFEQKDRSKSPEHQNTQNEAIKPDILIRRPSDNEQHLSSSTSNQKYANKQTKDDIVSNQDQGQRDDLDDDDNDDDSVFPIEPKNPSLPSQQEGSDQCQVTFKDPSVSTDESDMRPPTKTWQQVTIGMIGLGMEICYATETAMYIPILLQLGLPDHFYSVTWFISPVLGLLLQPFIGSCSDRCRSPLGRRRPFLLALGLGIIIGVSLLLNGEYIGLKLGDVSTDHSIGIIITMFGQVLLGFSANSSDTPARSYMMDVFNTKDLEKSLSYRALLNGLGAGIGYIVNGISWEPLLGNKLKQLQVVFIINGTLCVLAVILTLCSIKETPLSKTKNRKELNEDNFSNQYRAVQNDDLYDAINQSHQYGTFLEPGGQSSLADQRSPLLGQRSHRSSRSSVGDDDTDLEWDNSFDFHHFDMPLPKQTRYHRRLQFLQSIKSEDDYEVEVKRPNPVRRKSTSSLTNEESDAPGSALQLLYSIVKMPRELRRLCFSTYLAWLGLAPIMLFFTDYMGQVVYHGDPKKPLSDPERILYQRGVQMGCWGMCIFAFSASVSAVLYGRLVQFLSYRTLFVWPQVLFAVGTGCQAIFSQNVYVTLALCLTFGFMFTTIQSTPYAILSEFHKSEKYVNSCGDHRRGLGTDVSCLTCMIFLAQITVSSIIGPLINIFKSHLVIVLFPSLIAFLSAIAASVFVIYEIRDDEKKEMRTRDADVSGNGQYQSSDEDESRPLLSRSVIN